MRSLAQLDPEQAAKALAEVGLPESTKQKNQLQTMVATEWVNRDLQGAIEWILALPPEERNHIMSEPKALLNPRRIAEVVQTIPRSDWPDGFVVGAVNSWLQSDPDAAIDWFLTQPEASEPRAVAKLMSGFAIHPVPALIALTRLEHISAESFSKRVHYTLLYHSVSSPGQRADLLKLRDSVQRTDLAAALDAALLKHDALKDPIAAREALAERNDLSEMQRVTVLRSAADQFRWHESVGGTLEWMAEQSDSDAAIVAQRALPDFLADSPEDAIPAVMEWINRLPEGQISSNCVILIARSVARSMIHTLGDVEAAANWAATVPPEPLREGAIGEAIDQWASVDPFAAAEWLGSLPEGAASDAAITGLVDEIEWDPETGVRVGSDHRRE